MGADQAVEWVDSKSGEEVSVKADVKFAETHTALRCSNKYWTVSRPTCMHPISSTGKTWFPTIGGPNFEAHREGIVVHLYFNSILKKVFGSE